MVKSLNYLIFVCFSFFIVLISFLDAYVNYLYPPLVETELNPLARLIIKLTNWQTLLVLKIIGTLICYVILQILYFKMKNAWIVVFTLSFLQILLIYYIFKE